MYLHKRAGIFLFSLLICPLFKRVSVYNRCSKNIIKWIHILINRIKKVLDATITVEYNYLVPLFLQKDNKILMLYILKLEILITNYMFTSMINLNELGRAQTST